MSVRLIRELIMDLAAKRRGGMRKKGEEDGVVRAELVKFNSMEKDRAGHFCVRHSQK